MDRIEELLERRSDLSTFLVHLTRDTESAARDNLLAILNELTIKAATPFGMAKQYQQFLKDTTATQAVVCFTETPLEHIWMMLRQMEGRSVRLAPYGLVFSKTSGRRSHCNPVWYLDISARGGRDWLTVPVNTLVAEAVSQSTGESGTIDAAALAGQSIFKITPFLEQMGPTNVARKEFWWEREWRHVDHFHFLPSSVVAVLAPADEHDWLNRAVGNLSLWSKARRLPPLLDPTWGLESMIAAMSGIAPEDRGPFPS